MARRRRIMFVITGLVAVVALIVAFVMNIVSDQMPDSVKGMWIWKPALIVLAPLLVAFTLLAWWLERRRPRGTLFQVSPLLDGWMWRPEADRAIRFLTGKDCVGVGLHGPGGIGKTSLAQAVCNEPRVRKYFRGGIVWASVGQQREKTEGAELIASICASLSEESPPLKDVSQMKDIEHLSHHLAELLAQRGRVLVVVDDIWNESQLEPFLALSGQARLLVTTQKPGVLPRRVTPVQVHALPPDAAGKMLCWELPQLGRKVRDELLDVTGGWPQLLGLVNRRLAGDVRNGAEVDGAAQKVIDQLREAGITALDITDSGMRRTAVKATIEYSLAVLPEDARTRFLELGIFAPDVDVPLEMAVSLWRTTTGLTEGQSEQLCVNLAGLSLLTLRWVPGGLRVFTVSNVIRLFSRSDSGLGDDQRIKVNRSLIDASREMVAEEGTPGTPWWRLPPEHFLWDQLAYHLAEASWQAELAALVANLDWVLARLERSGPWALESDLSLSTAEESAQIRRLIARVGYLLGDLENSELTTSSRRTHLSTLPGFRAQVEHTAADRPNLLPMLPIPESRDSDPIRTLPAHHDPVNAVAITEQGRLATGSRDGILRLWDIDKGTLIRQFTGHTAAVTAVAVAPDGTWLATASEDRTIHLWNGEDGTVKAVCRGHTAAVTTVAIAADGTRLASASLDGTVRVWDTAGREKGVIPVQGGWIHAVAISPDSTWLATASLDGKVRLWHANGAPMMTLPAHERSATALAISSDGKWIVSASEDTTLRLSDKEGSVSRVLNGHAGPVKAVAFSPDGKWLASASDDATVRMWNTDDGTVGAIFTGHTDAVTAVAISPEGTRLASASAETVRIWDTTDAAGNGTTSEHIGSVLGVAAAPGGKWLASGSDDATVRLWNVRDGRQVAVLEGHTGAVTSVAVAPGGTWLASASRDKTVRLWHLNGDREPVVLKGHTRWVNAVAIAPDGTWLVSAADDVHVRLWETRHGTEQRRLTGYNGWVHAVAVAPNGKWLASAYMEGQGVRLWNTDGTQKGHVLREHTGAVAAIAISPDGKWLAAAFVRDHSVQFWNADGVRRRALTGHSDRIRAVAISPDGTWLASASEDKTIRLWTTGENPRCVAAVRCGGKVFDICWGSPHTLVAGGARGLYVFTLSGASPARSLPDQGGNRVFA